MTFSRRKLTQKNYNLANGYPLNALSAKLNLYVLLFMYVEYCK